MGASFSIVDQLSSASDEENLAFRHMIYMFKNKSDNVELFKHLRKMIPKNIDAHTTSEFTCEFDLNPMSLASKYGCFQIIELLLNEKGLKRTNLQ